MEQQPLTVATLNYCDIMNNPFEFYCQDFQEDLAHISEVYLRLLPTYFPNFDKNKFAWKMGKIDQKIRVGRYSPAFALYVGIKNDGFMTREEFQKKWDEEFDKLPESKQIEFSEEDRKTTRLYDFILFHTLLAHAFKEDKFQQLIKNPADVYMNKYRPFYELSFLSEEKKMEVFLQTFSKIEADIFFLQEYSEKLAKEIEKTNRYHVATDDAKDKLIIANKKTFKVKKPAKDLLKQQQLAELKWSEGPAILIADNYIMLNAHLSSKKQKCLVQMDKMKKSLLALNKQFPNYHIIVGGDINIFMGFDGTFEKTFNFYPTKEEELTTIKKRTMTQGQYHKGNIVVAESKDKIMSTLKLIKGSIRYIDNTEAGKEGLIPTDRHPFDHFVLVVNLKRP